MTNAQRNALITVLAAALLLRIAALLLNYNNLDFAGSLYQQGETARNILAGRGITQNSDYLAHVLERANAEHRLIDFEDILPPQQESVRPDYNNEPGYGIFLSALWRVTGSERWIYPRVLQGLVDVAMCWIMFLVGSRLFSVRVGLLSSAFYAVFVPEIEMAIRPYRDVWVTFLFVVSIWYLTSVTGKETSLRKQLVASAGIGVFAAAVCWMRSTVLVYPLAIIAVLWVILPRRDALRLAAVLVVTFGVVYAPFFLRSEEDFGKPMVTRGAFWHSFWGGIGQFPNPYGVVEDDRKIYQFGKSLDPNAAFNTDAYEQALKKKAFEMLREHPVFYASTVVRRALVIAFPRLGRALFFQEPPQEAKTGLLNQLGRMGKWGLVGVDAGLGLLFLCGIYVHRKRPASLLIVLLPFLYTLVTLAPFYVTGRNIANAYCSEMILASAGFALLAGKVLGRATGGRTE